MPDRLNYHTLTAAIIVFLIDFAGRVMGCLIDDRFYDIGVAFAFVAVYCNFYYTACNRNSRLIISGLMFYVILSAFKEVSLNPTRFYPAEIISIIPVAYSVITERRRLKSLQR